MTTSLRFGMLISMVEYDNGWTYLASWASESVLKVSVRRQKSLFEGASFLIVLFAEFAQLLLAKECSII